MNPADPRRIPTSNTARDAVIAVFCGLLILGFIIYGMTKLGSPSAGNRLTGTVTAKHFTPVREQQIEFGKKGMKARETDGEYTLEVRVESENRIYEVPVEKKIYESKEVGDSLSFLRPRSEQQ